MSAKHTPGPWRADRIGAAWRGTKERGMCYRIEAPESSSAKNLDVAVVYNKPIFEDAQANARLIAAAPALLAALEDVELRCTQARIASTIGKGKDRTEFLRGELERIADQARAAIDKATKP